MVSDALGYSGITNNLDNGAQSKTPVWHRTRWCARHSTLAIDRPALVKVVYNDMYTPTVQAVSKSSPFYDTALPPPPRDVAKAKALLKQAGVTLPVKVELLTPNQPDVLQEAEVIQSMAAEAGFDVHIQAMEFASSLAASTRGEFEAYLIGWSGRVDIDGNTYHSCTPARATTSAITATRSSTSCWNRRAALTDMAKRACGLCTAVARVAAGPAE